MLADSDVCRFHLIMVVVGNKTTLRDRDGLYAIWFLKCSIVGWESRETDTAQMF